MYFQVKQDVKREKKNGTGLLSIEDVLDHEK